MKRIIITFLFVFTLHFSFSQSLVNENNRWSVVECMNFAGCGTNTYEFNGDTVINNKTYKKLFVCFDSLLTDWYYRGAMREDSPGKVFGYEVFGSFYPDSEVLYYDFTLGLGDTIGIPCSGGSEILTVIAVDTTTLLNGEQRKRLRFSSILTGEEEWIDGIGSLFGLINIGASCFIDMYYTLNCFTENDILKYDDPQFEGCYLSTVGIQKHKGQLAWQLSPNPFSDFCILQFENKSGAEFQLRIFSADGRMVQSYDNITSETVTIHRAQLKSGLYFFRLEQNKRLAASGKLLVL